MTDLIAVSGSAKPNHPNMSPKTREFFHRAVAEGGNYTVIARELWPYDSNPTRKAAKLIKLYPGYIREVVLPHTEKLIPRALRTIQEAMESETVSLKDRAEVAFKFVAMADKFHSASQGQGGEGVRGESLDELMAKALVLMGPERARAALHGIVDARLLEKAIVARGLPMAVPESQA